MRLNKLNEIDIINLLSSSIKTSNDVKIGIGDDTAVIKKDKGKFLLFTTDMFLEGVHFRIDSKYRLEKIGRKALAANLSDIAAMAGTPKYAVISIGVRSDFDFDYLDRIYKGIKQEARKYKVDIVGGDTIAAGKLVINIALIGEVLSKNITLRNTAKPGDSIFVTGSLGGSIKGKHYDFTPRIKEAGILSRRFNITSMIDISDGLIYDSYRVAKASNVRFKLLSDKIPITKECRLKDALYDGEDFELLFTADKKSSLRLIKNTKVLGKTKLTHIGYVEDGFRDVILVDKDDLNIPLKIKGYDHFS